MLAETRPSVRPRRPADLPACLRSLRAVHERDGYPAQWPADPTAWLTPPSLAAWVCGAVSGHVLLVAGTPADGLAYGTGDPPAVVSRLFVRPDARGGGRARLLLAAATAAADRPVGLEVADSGVAARALYESLGWRRVGSGRAGWLDVDGLPALVHRYLAPTA